MVNTHQRHEKCVICKTKFLYNCRHNAQLQQYHPILINEELLPDGSSPTAGWDRPDPLWFDFSQWTWMAIQDHSRLLHLRTDISPGAPPPGDTLYIETIDPRMPDLACTPPSNNDEGSKAVSCSGKFRGQGLWQRNLIVRQATQVIRKTESMASISVMK